MSSTTRTSSILIALLVAFLARSSLAQEKSDSFLSVDHFVPHVSTVPANAGQLVGIYVREKVDAQVARTLQKRGAAGKVVLFVHGGTTPSVPVYSLDYKDYNWMDFLARAGFRTFAMDFSGYGSSPKPMMDDPCNVDPKQQATLVPRPLKGPCAPNYPRALNTINDDWNEIDSVVDYLRKLNRVAKIHIIGWSAGGPRAGGYAALHPEKIDRMVFYAPSAPTSGPLQDRSAAFPISLQTRDDLEKKRWDPDVRCPGQVEPGVRDVLWQSIMQWDRVGASWGPEEGVMRARTVTRFGWTSEIAAKVKAPALVIVGEFDQPDDRRKVFEQISSNDKVFLHVACASHFMVWEKQHKVLHVASKEWLTTGRVKSLRRGEFKVDTEGNFKTETSLAMKP